MPRVSLFINKTSFSSPLIPEARLLGKPVMCQLNSTNFTVFKKWHNLQELQSLVDQVFWNPSYIQIWKKRQSLDLATTVFRAFEALSLQYLHNLNDGVFNFPFVHSFIHLYTHSRDVEYSVCHTHHSRMCALLLRWFRLLSGDSMDCSPPSFSVHGTSRLRMLEYVAIYYSWVSSPPCARTCIFCASCIGRWILYHCSTWEAPFQNTKIKKKIILKEWFPALKEICGSLFPVKKVHTYKHSDFCIQY